MRIWAEFGGWRPPFGWPVGRFRVKKEETAAFLIEYGIFSTKPQIPKMAQTPSSYYTLPFNAEYYDNEAMTTTITYARPVLSMEHFLMPFVAPPLDRAMHRLEIAKDTESESSDEDEATDFDPLFGPIPPVALVVLPAVVIPKLPAVGKTVTKTITETITETTTETTKETTTETITETTTETTKETTTTRKAKRVCHRACLI